MRPKFSDLNSFFMLLLLLMLLVNCCLVSETTAIGFEGGGVIQVNYKFAGLNRSLTLSALKQHDTVRHIQISAGVDLPIGGTGRPDAVGLYYAKIGIGTPSKDYYVQIDTGSDIMWVNCIQCRECPRRGYRGLELTLYDPKESLTSGVVSCDREFCKEIMRGTNSNCKTNQSCLYTEVYGDGSFSLGYFIEDVVQYDRVSGDLQTRSANGSVIFGCGAGQIQDLGGADDALDGILGFGKSNSSMISQLAASGRVRKMFAHCLDGVNGGGIFAIGHVVQPKVNTTPLVANHVCSLKPNTHATRVLKRKKGKKEKKKGNFNISSTRTHFFSFFMNKGLRGIRPHYNVNMTGVQVGREFLNFSIDLYMLGDKNGAVIDSGTTLAYLPELIYEPLVKKILSWQPDLRLQLLRDQYTCFDYSDSVDDGFPPVTLHFDNSLLLKVYPHEYLFPFEDLMCIGWQNSGMLSKDKKNFTILGDLVLSSKLVLYDLENQTIGWTEYNCSSSIKLKDEITGSVHLVGAHSLSGGSCLSATLSLTILLLSLLYCFVFMNS